MDYICHDCGTRFERSGPPRRTLFAGVVAAVSVLIGIIAAFEVPNENRLMAVMVMALIGSVLFFIIYFSQPGGQPLRHRCPNCKGDNTGAAPPPRAKHVSDPL